MILEDVYNQLAYSELRQVFTGDLNDPQIAKTYYQELLPSVKLGVTELHKRFFLREGEFKVVLQADQISYVLDERFAVSNTGSSEAVKYLDDTQHDDFKNAQLHKVERIYGMLEEKEIELPLNRLDDPNAIRTPRYNMLVIPSDSEKARWLDYTTELRVIYRQDHPEMKAARANASPRSVQIELPGVYLEALTYYVASRMLNPQGSSAEGFHEGNNYLAKFEAAVAQLQQQNYQVDQDDFNSKLQDRGFV